MEASGREEWLMGGIGCSFGSCFHGLFDMPVDDSEMKACLTWARDERRRLRVKRGGPAGDASSDLCCSKRLQEGTRGGEV
jgi:hypothetical protein